MSNIDDILGPLTTVADANVNVDNDRIGHGLRLHVSGHDADGKRMRVEVEVPATHIPALMVAIASHGGNVLAEIADSWRRGDCATCNNVRMVQVPRSNGSTWSEHCPDCSGPGSALTGYPVPHREGEPSRQGQDVG